MRELYEAGQIIQELANHCDVSVNAIYNRLRKTGVTMRNTGSRRTPEAKQALKVKIAQLCTQGLSQNKIAETVGVSRSTVRRYLKSSTKNC